MESKRGIFTRLVSGFVAAAMVFGLVAVNIPGFVTETAAVGDTLAELPTYHVTKRARKDGLYTIHPADNTALALDIGTNSVASPNTNVVLDKVSEDPSQRFVIQVDQQNYGTAYGDDAVYGIRSVPSDLWLGATAADSNVQQTNQGNYRNTTCQWQIIDNGDGTVLIKHLNTGQYLYVPSVAYTQAAMLGTPDDGSDIPSNYKWVLNQAHMQDDYFVTGTYWIETRVGSQYGDSTTQTVPANVVTVSSGVADISAYRPATEVIPDEDGYVTKDLNRAYYESQHFVIQKLSGGFYSIVNVATGKYLAVSGNGIAEGQNSGLAPNPEERWIIYPGKASGNSSSAAWKFRIISAVDGRQLTVAQESLSETGTTSLSASDMVNKEMQDWYLKDIRLDVNNQSKGDTQITNSGVYADTFNTGSTVTLPIKIFDYAADGMLFEYASLDTAAEYGYLKVEDGLGDHVISHYTYEKVEKIYGSYNLNEDGTTYTYVGYGNGDYKRETHYKAEAGGDYIKYRLGCNLGFSMLSCSKGGTLGADWAPSSFESGKLTWNRWNIGNGSASFGNNKYYCPFISELRLLYEANTDGNNPELNTDTPSYERVINDYVLNGKYDGIASNAKFKSAVLVTAGTMNTASAGIDYSNDQYVEAALGYRMIGQQTFGQATMGLLEAGLEKVVVNGKTYTLPRYRQETVEYIAMLLQRSLEINRQSENTLNYNYVDGEVSFADDTGLGLDLAALLRGETDKTDSQYGAGVLDRYTEAEVTTGTLANGETAIGTNFTRYGSYADTMAKINEGKMLIGSWADVKDNIDTCMDAAYWMLNSIFLENSYNEAQDRYNSLILTQVTDHEGKTGYIFDSTFITSSSSEMGSSAVQYDSATGTIRNTSAAGKSYTYWGTGSSAATYPFTPVRTDTLNEKGEVIANGDGTASNPKGIQNGTQSPYGLDGGVKKSQVGNTEAEYENANYNFVLQSNAYFVYKHSDGLFFEFEGDDDVYLFINGQLVLDIGGAHAVTGTKLDLNEYVDWARELKKDATAYAKLTETEKTRVDALALVDGNTYSFDFYYMERHGWGSNMRIFTNFQLASGEIQAEKSAQQNDSGLSYGSVVDDSELVEYTFAMTNSGTTNLIWATFKDNDIGVTISYESGLTVADSTVVFDQSKGELGLEDLVFTYTPVDGEAVVWRYSAETYETVDAYKTALLNWLKNVLYIKPGEKLTVGGIYYKLTQAQISAGAFHNELEVTAFVRNDGANANEPTGSLLRDEATFSVYLLSRPLYYQWRGNAIEITAADILAQVKIAAKDADNPLNALVPPELTVITSMEIVSNSDSDSTVNITNNVLNVNYDGTGIKTIGLKISFTYEKDDETLDGEATIPVQIFVLDVMDHTYVLDYGLKVQLSYNALFGGDKLTVVDRTTVFEVLGLATEDTVPVYVSRDYLNQNQNGGTINSINFAPISGWTVSDTDTDDYDGSFAVTPGATGDAVFLTYTPSDFMDGRDTVYLAVRVRESDHTDDASIGTTDIANEVEMFKKITVLPANVVYYEDDFAGVTYKTDKDTFTPTSEHDQAQSADQSEQYGHDDVYAGSTDVTMSGGTIATITLGEKQDKTLEAATFTFKGTGFEMISRTNAADSAIIQVMVTGVFEAGGTSTTKYYPIITEFDQITTTGTDQTSETDEVYQVPVFRLTDLPYGEFTVTISGIPSYEFDSDFNPYIRPTKLYIDGIRIYNPLEDPTASEYGDELGAQFTELRTLVFNSQAAAIGLSYQENTTDTPVMSGTFGQHGSFTENLNKGWFEDTSGNLQQFAIAGPNNEVYMGSSGDNAVVLFVKETAANTEGLLHIGVHDLDESDFEGGTAANGASAIRYWTEEGWVDITVGTSGTEQYYPIDYRSCPKVDENSEYYYVVIQVNSGMVSFTNVKTVGLEFGELEKTTENVRYKYENGVLMQAPLNADTWTEVSCPLVTRLLSLKSVLRENTNAGQPDAEQPDGDHTGSDEPVEENPATGDVDLLWAAVLIGLLGLAALVPMIRKEVRA